METTCALKLLALVVTLTALTLISVLKLEVVDSAKVETVLLDTLVMSNPIQKLEESVKQ
jgi:hypothetical protein